VFLFCWGGGGGGGGGGNGVVSIQFPNNIYISNKKMQVRMDINSKRNQEHPFPLEPIESCFVAIRSFLRYYN
jgi:hypothetical protein